MNFMVYAQILLYYKLTFSYVKSIYLYIYKKKVSFTPRLSK